MAIFRESKGSTPGAAAAGNRSAASASPGTAPAGELSVTAEQEERLALAAIGPAKAGDRAAIAHLRAYAQERTLKDLVGHEFQAKLFNTIRATNIALGSPKVLADELRDFAVQELRTTTDWMLLVAPSTAVQNAILKLAGMGVPVARDAGQGFLSVRVAKATGEIQVAGIPQLPAYQRMVRQIGCKMIGWKEGDRAPEINAVVWRAKDSFDYEINDGVAKLQHKPNVRPAAGEPNPIEGAYCVIALPGQSPFIVVRTMEQILTQLGKDPNGKGETKPEGEAAEGGGGKKNPFYSRVPENEWTNAVLRVACREWIARRSALNPEASLLAGALLREESVYTHEQETGKPLETKPASMLVTARVANGAAMLRDPKTVAPAAQPTVPPAADAVAAVGQASTDQPAGTGTLPVPPVVPTQTSSFFLPDPREAAAGTAVVAPPVSNAEASEPAAEEGSPGKGPRGRKPAASKTFEFREPQAGGAAHAL